MKKLAVLCVLLTGMGFILSPAYAGGSALQVIDFPKAELMIVFADREAAMDAKAHMDVQGCGKYSLINLVDYSAGKDRSATLPWNHKMVARDEWKQLECWFKNSVEVKNGKAGLLPTNTPKAEFYEVTSSAADAVSRAETGDEVKAILDSSKVPAISKYILEKEHQSWWPPTVPDEVPVL
ncbi:MAG: hypothetical protein JEZ02_07210 [Desulfatibacillum sp.]|nr:hypothetical protein [Desulfatibacillum sp.]